MAVTFLQHRARIDLIAPAEGSVAKMLTESGQHRTIYLEPGYHKASFLDKIARENRIIIVEGISGSGKDTLQSYLKSRLVHRDVYDYSEGELLQSWNQLQIGGIFELRVKFMKLFVNHIKDVIDRDKEAVFLLNRFHLSVYAMTIAQQPRLEKEYKTIINVLRTLPVHVLILRLREHEIERRSLHPERSRAWQRFQEQIVKSEGFRNRLERYLFQQRLMLEAAERQGIPYSVISLGAEGGRELLRYDRDGSPGVRSAQANPLVGKNSHNKRQRHLPACCK